MITPAHYIRELLEMEELANQYEPICRKTWCV
jgi:hypothetical protein